MAPFGFQEKMKGYESITHPNSAKNRSANLSSLFLEITLFLSSTSLLLLSLRSSCSLFTLSVSPLLPSNSSISRALSPSSFEN